MPVAAVDWRENAVHYATGDERQSLIRQCKSFFVYTIEIVFRFVSFIVSYLSLALPFNI
jgi:hypothetical protein